MDQFFSQVLVSQDAVGTAFSSFTTAKSILNVNDVYPIPQPWFTRGLKLRVSGLLAVSNIVTTPGTFALQVNMGSVAAFTSGNIQLNATAHTLLPLPFSVTMRLDSVGSGTAAKWLGAGWVAGIQPTLTAAQVDAVNTSGLFQAPVTAPAVGTGFDSSVSQNLDLFFGFSISNAANTVQIYDYTVERLR